MNNNNRKIFSEYRDMALTNLLEAISNRRLIQHLRLQLFKNVDFQPKDFNKLNLKNSIIEKDIYWWIYISASDILEQLTTNKTIYFQYFSPRNNPRETNVRDLMLPGEEEKFGWEIIYQEHLEKFINDEQRKENDPIGYFQKIYEFIMLDLTYDDEWETFISE